MALLKRNIFSKNPEAPNSGENYNNNESEDDSFSEDETPKSKEKNKRPKENSFTQQKLRAFHPIITPKYIIIIFFTLAVFLLGLGGGMIYASYNVQDLIIDYTKCNDTSIEYYSDVPLENVEYHFKSDATISPKWKYALNSSESDPTEQGICKLQFQIPNDIGSPVFLFYQIENFYANHRRYVKSYSEDQLNGKAASLSDIKDTVGQNCQPLSENEDGVRIYPCGLIANSLFNDTFSSLSAVNDTTEDYQMTNKGIAWSTNKNRMQKTKYSASEVVPPPNWIKMFPDGYNDDNMPDISTWSEFQNWMQTSALPKFSKLALRNDNDVLKAGTYEVEVGLHWPVQEFNGKKSLYISTRSVIGGRNPFLGIIWVVAGGLCLIISLVFVVFNLFAPRKVGDISKLSWNQNKSD
ncbi:hypothetical protein WICPIJ_005804 [Wickerhamomyces pijperi]|uniref:Alkylphosphocholine resistance protein LEM3 n=1 Tax=Wickerhamomyces pijperi TaxID=599730 RepID=A0A9P8Q3A7_WICPI|nr:hypothetical protein WICPIJ_005804 [Wickerhamomyces pijperi]